MIMKINGTITTITTITSPADALCYLYTINFPLLKKKKKKIPTYRSFQRKISRREKNSHIIVSEVSFSTSRPNLSTDKYNGTQSLEASNSNKRLLETKPGKSCIWCVNYSLQQESKESVDWNPTKVRPIPS